MQDLDTLKYFLRIEVARNASGLYLSLHKYALDIISETGLSGARPTSIPKEPNHNLATNKSSLTTDATKYRHLVERLIYLTIIQPEFAYSVHILSQFMQKPRLRH